MVFSAINVVRITLKCVIQYINLGNLGDFEISILTAINVAWTK
jgi:hypothetical protein